jgi:hypothetical protein
MKIAKFLVSTAIFLIGGLLVARLIAVVAAPHLLVIAGQRQLAAIGFTEPRIERAWVDFDGVHLVGIQLDSRGSATARAASVPLSLALLRGDIGRMTLEGVEVRGWPRGTATGAGLASRLGFAIDAQDIDLALGDWWRARLTLAVQPGGNGTARVALNGTLHYAADTPALPPLQVAAALTARDESLAGRLRLNDSGRLLDLRVDVDRTLATGETKVEVAGAPVDLARLPEIAAAAPALARALDGHPRATAGTLELDASLAWDGKTLRSTARLALGDVRLAAAPAPWSGTLAFDSLAPPRLAAEQALRLGNNAALLDDVGRAAIEAIARALLPFGDER